MSQSECGSRTSPERMESSASSLGIVPFGFHSKTQYDANETLIQIRSEKYEPTDPIKDNDIWKRPPPDFRPQIFAPKPPKRNSRDSMKPWDFGTIPGQRGFVKRERQKIIPHILLPQKKDEGRFITTGRMMRPFTAKKRFVTEGMYHPGEFEDIKEHDFRGVSQFYYCFSLVRLEAGSGHFEFSPFYKKQKKTRNDHLLHSKLLRN